MSFLGLEIAKRALLAQRQAMEVVAHNVANARTPGFSRQRVDLRTTTPATEVIGHGIPTAVGTGVEVADIARVRDAFLDQQYREQARGLGEWQTRQQVLDEVQQLLNEPSDTSLRVVLDQFWVAWQTLANNPENLAARQAVVEQGNTLVDAFRHLDARLSEIQANLDKAIGTKVDEINLLAREIAGLNQRIATTSAAGGQANDLLDQRDLLLDKLARLVGVQVLDGPNGMVRMLVNGVAVVDGASAYRLLAQPDPANNGFLSLRWEGFPSLQVAGKDLGGEMAASFDLRDNVLAAYRSRLKDLAWALATQVNARHAAGYDLNGAPVSGTSWQDFFVVPASKAAFDLQTLAVNPQVAADPRRIAAASQAGSPGDGRNALAIADLKFQQLADLNNFTADDFYRSLIGTVGAQAGEAQRMSDTQKALTDRIDNQRQAASGVNLDEEVADLVRFQQAFQAAARLVSMVDEALGTVINRMGVVGR